MKEKFRILVFCESPKQLLTFKNVLRHQRRLVTTFCDTTEAACNTIRNSQPFHAVIASFDPKPENGQQILAETKARSPDSKLLAVGGLGDQDHIIEAIKAGAYDYLYTPFRPEELYLCLNRITERFEIYEENYGLREVVVKLQKELNAVREENASQADKIRDLETQLELRNQEKDLAQAIEEAARRKTGDKFSYDVFHELKSLNDLLDENKITDDEFQEYRRAVLEKVYRGRGEHQDNEPTISVG